VAIYHLSARVGSNSKGNRAGGLYQYIARQGKHTDEDLRVLHSGNMPAWAADDAGIYWQSADRYERANGTLYREVEFALPRELTEQQNQRLADEFARATAGDQPFTYALHGGDSPHCHLMISERISDGHDRSPSLWFARAANRSGANAKAPEQGGARKVDLGKSVDRQRWLSDTRERWSEYCNTHLRHAGFNIQIDHRSYADRGVDLTPQVKLGAYNARLMRAGESNERIQRYAQINQLRASERELKRLQLQIKQLPTPALAKKKPAPAKAAKRRTAPVPRTRYDDYCDAVSELDKRMRDAKSKFDNDLEAIKEKTWTEKALQKIGVLVSDAEQERIARGEYSNTRQECEKRLKELRDEYAPEIAAKKRENAPELSEERKREIEYVKQKNAEREASERRNSEFKVQIDSAAPAKHSKPKL
jgi:hypothetical protein